MAWWPGVSPRPRSRTRDQMEAASTVRPTSTPRGRRTRAVLAACLSEPAPEIQGHAAATPATTDTTGRREMVSAMAAYAACQAGLLSGRAPFQGPRALPRG